ncbi:MAG: S8 family serine peptidase [Actinomycetota bacterium]
MIDYEPDDSYIVWASTAEARRAARLDVVGSVVAVPVARKLGSGLPDLSDPSTTPLDLQLTVYGPRVAAAIDALTRLGSVGRISRARPDGFLATVGATAPASALRGVLDLPAVLYAAPAPTGLVPEDEMGDQVVAGNIERDTNRPFPGYRRWLRKKDLNGKGFIVSVVDTGISDQHPDLAGKIVATYDYSPLAEPVDTGGHGTHVAGIIGGNPPKSFVPGVPEHPPFGDPDGFTYGIGVAPRTKFVDQNAIGLVGQEFPPPDPNGFERLTTDAWESGARMWNASWHTGEGARVGYLANTRVIDELARDAVYEKNGAQQFLFVFSAGNTGTSGPTVPKEAKNIIAVGATNSGRGEVWPMESDIDEVASFSSQGPTKDGRIFPTISAPGASVMSARAPEGAITATCVPPPDGALLYANCSGTSMAAPHVAGAAVLIHQWWRRTFGDLPSPAMVRGLLVNTATDIAKADIPNMAEGWGRINLGELFADRAARYVDQNDVLHRTGEDKAYEIDVKAPSRPLKVTLTWNDAPGAVGAKKVLVNDLDLMVELIEGGRVVERWRGNVFEKGRSIAGGKADRVNNTENVFLDAPRRGTYRITVTAANLPADVRADNSDTTEQDFALIARWGRPD